MSETLYEKSISNRKVYICKVYTKSLYLIEKSIQKSISTKSLYEKSISNRKSMRKVYI